MGHDQEWINRSHGQKHRYERSDIEKQKEKTQSNSALTQQTIRDIKVIKARLETVEGRLDLVEEIHDRLRVVEARLKEFDSEYESFEF